MAVPDYQTLMLPLLRCLERQDAPIAVREFVDPIADEFGLTDDERAQRIPSGLENLLSNRLAWARTYLGKAGLVEAPKRGAVKITEAGRQLLGTRPDRIDIGTLKNYPSFVEWAASGASGGSGSKREPKAQTQPNAPEAQASSGTPTERIDQARQELEHALKSELLDRVHGMSAGDFEALIIRLLLAMGYGQGLEELGRALGGSSDGGMDGVIHQDPLGLDRVYIQAKRWKEGSGVSSPDIRNFVGALNIHRANKGVFVTASHFTAEAMKAASGSTVQVVLIDGVGLADLMVRYKVGVLTRGMVEIKEIDEGFFEI